MRAPPLLREGPAIHKTCLPKCSSLLASAPTFRRKTLVSPRRFRGSITHQIPLQSSNTARAPGQAARPRGRQKTRQRIPGCGLGRRPMGRPENRILTRALRPESLRSLQFGGIRAGQNRVVLRGLIVRGVPQKRARGGGPSMSIKKSSPGVLTPGDFWLAFLLHKYY